MTDLNAMWDALAKYQPYADADGHGETWRVMCEERTEEAARAAQVATWAGSAAWEAAWEAAWAAAWAAANAGDVMRWSALAVERIEAALKEREPALSNIEPTSSDGGQAQTVDAQHSEIEKLKAERDAATLAERKAVLDILWDYAGRKDLSDSDESLLKHLVDIIRARSKP